MTFKYMKERWDDYSVESSLEEAIDPECAMVKIIQLLIDRKMMSLEILNSLVKTGFYVTEEEEK